MTVAQFLNKLPSQVVRGGKLVEIRDSVAQVLQVRALREFESWFCSLNILNNYSTKQGTEKAKPVKEIVIETDVSRKPE